MKSLILAIAGILLLIGATMPLMGFTTYAPLTFTVGALWFAAIQFHTRPKTDHPTLRRLLRQQALGDILLVATGCMMFMSKYDIEPCPDNEWMLGLAVAAVFQVYTAFRIPSVEERMHKD